MEVWTTVGPGVPVAALTALLVVAFGHPSPRREALVSLGAVAAVLAVGALPAADAADELRRLAPVVGFLLAVLVVADVAARAGVFSAAGDLLARRCAGPDRLLAGVGLLGAVVTSVLSLDATVLLLIPVAVTAATSRGFSPRPVAHLGLRVANSVSMLLPVSNLTTLLALPWLGLTATAFVARTAPVMAVVLVVEVVAVRLLAPRGPVPAPAPAPAPAPVTADEQRPALAVPVTVVVLMLVGFVAGSAWGVDPVWPAAAAASVLAGWALRRGLATGRGLVNAAHPTFAGFVLALGLVVAAVVAGPAGGAVARLLPHGAGYADLLLLAGLGALLSCLLTNLSATLVLAPLVAPLGTDALLATLLGLSIGAGLTVSGSLATLLWRRTVRRVGLDVGLLELHRVSLVATPVSLLAAVTTLWVLA
ncbi:SLC13 family permease [Nocardioides sp. GY 10127]|uniref:SLC13 family permease n=1 Tax=Nocardioides sp. GY 10127 TaxID=2569762 RepID=UPI001458D727|nr:SLC13 family permease [Nocardioides sp. GY 10127]